MCQCSIHTCFDHHLELFCRKRIRIINAQEGSLCLFNKGTLLVYSSILNLLLVILSGFNA